MLCIDFKKNAYVVEEPALSLNMCVFSASEKAPGRGNAVAHIHFPLRLTVAGCVGGATPCVCVCVLCLWLWEHWLAPCSPPQTVAPTLSKLQPPLLAPRLYIPEKKRKEKKRQNEGKKEQWLRWSWQADLVMRRTEFQKCAITMEKKTHLFKTFLVSPRHILVTVEIVSSL